MAFVKAAGHESTWQVKNKGKKIVIYDNWFLNFCKYDNIIRKNDILFYFSNLPIFLGAMFRLGFVLAKGGL